MKKVQNFLLDLALDNIKKFTYLSYIVNILTGIVIIYWLLKKTIPQIGDVDLEALVTILSIFAASLNQLNRKLFEKIEYSPADVLALGYVNNFLVPALTQLKQNGVKTPNICIYRSAKINELEPANIDNLKADLKNRNYFITEIKLNLKQNRARDILNIHKNKKQQTYFDFPTTLLSLLLYIDYKADSKANFSADKMKAELGDRLLSEFYFKVDELAKDKRIENNISYCDFNMEIFGSS